MTTPAKQLGRLERVTVSDNLPHKLLSGELDVSVAAQQTETQLAL